MKKLNLKWVSEKRNISDLIPAAYNPRQLTKDQHKQLSQSIEEYDVADPIIINIDNTIIGGHQRFKILKEKGFAEIDVRVPHRLLTPTEEKRLNLRLNKNIGEWDMNLLANFDVDMLQDVGFTDNDLGIDLDLEDDKSPKEETYKEKFCVIVDLENENQQKDLYDKLKDLGYDNIKILSL
jgi:ParB-like chromosome segregation protein Spo0J